MGCRRHLSDHRLTEEADLTERSMSPARRRSGTARTLGLGAVGALGLGAAFAAPAWAHDTLIGSTPESDEILTESPEEVVLEFSGEGLTQGEQITNDIWVLDQDQENWASEDPADVDGPTMSTDLDDELPDGEYEVQYRAVYSDGHDEERSFSFEVDAGEEPTSQQDEATQDEAAEDETGGTDSNTDDAADSTDGTDGTEDAEQEPAVEEGTVPAWTLWALAGGAVVVAVLVAWGVRRRLKE